MRFVAVFILISLAASSVAEAACSFSALAHAPTDPKTTFFRENSERFGTAHAGSMKHTGFDLLMKTSNSAMEKPAYEIRAIESGVVVYAQRNQTKLAGYGNVVVIDHGGNCYSMYAQVANEPFTPVNPGESLELVKVGDTVNAGKVIGYISDVNFGTTGNARKTKRRAHPHTHIAFISAIPARSDLKRPENLIRSILAASAKRQNLTCFFTGRGYKNYKAD